MMSNLVEEAKRQINALLAAAQAKACAKGELPEADALAAVLPDAEPAAGADEEPALPQAASESARLSAAMTEIIFLMLFPSSLMFPKLSGASKRPAAQRASRVCVSVSCPRAKAQTGENARQ